MKKAASTKLSQVEKQILEAIARDSVMWTLETVKIARELESRGLVSYTVNFPDGYFIITELGRELLGGQNGKQN